MQWFKNFLHQRQFLQKTKHFSKNFDFFIFIEKYTQNYIYEVFYSEKPLSIHKLDEIYHEKLPSADCGVKEALAEAKFALEAFFALPRLVQVRLTHQSGYI